MKRYPLVSIKHIEDGKLFYTDESNDMKEIILKDSANGWWNKHNKNKLSPQRLMNKYVADTHWVEPGECYMEFFSGKDTIRFYDAITADMDSIDISDLKEVWDGILSIVKQEGFWLADE